MTVLILANNDVGLYRFRKALIEELLKDHEVYISLPYGELVEPLKSLGCKFIDTPLERRGMNPISDAKLLFKYMKIINMVKPSLVITYTIKPNIYGGVAARIAGIPYAVNITGLGTAFQNCGVLRTVATIMYKIACRKAKTVFFENIENQQIFIEENMIDASQACLLNGAGVDLDHYHVTDYPKGEMTKFLFMGRVMKEKGIDELFSAMKRLVDDNYACSLDVIGDYEEDYKKKIEDYEAQGWLKYWGYQVDVRPFIAETHCFVLPSWHEGMANTNLECAASGRPVITSNIHGCKEAVEDGVTGFLCEKQNADDLYSVMKKFLDTSFEKRKGMGLAGRKRMEEVFDKKKVVEMTLKQLFR